MSSGNRTATVLSYVRCPLSLDANVEELLERYKTAAPFPYLVLDNLFPSEVLDALLAELPPLTSEKWVHDRQDETVKSNLRSAVDLGDRGHEFASMLHSAGFLYFLSEITGIRPLLGDPYLTGGGYHVVPEGGKFDIHADRNTDHFSGLERRLAMLTYLNKEWKPEYGGQLELWNQDATKCEQVVEPMFNRTAIFQIGDKNFHGVRPVVGKGRMRRSFAAYFHSVGRGIRLHNSLYAPQIYRDKTGLAKVLVREALPPFLYRALKNVKPKTT